MFEECPHVVLLFIYAEHWSLHISEHKLFLLGVKQPSHHTILYVFAPTWRFPTMSLKWNICDCNDEAGWLLCCVSCQCLLRGDDTALILNELWVSQGVISPAAVSVFNHWSSHNYVNEGMVYEFYVSLMSFLWGCAICWEWDMNPICVLA